MFWLLIGVMFALGALLGSFTRIPLVLAFTYWVVVGWNGDDYGRLVRLGFEASELASGGLVKSAVRPGALEGSLPCGTR